MNGFDLTVVILTAVLVGIGFWKGLVRILVTIGALIAAFMVASHYHAPLAELFARSKEPSAGISIVAYVVIFLVVMLIGGAIAFYLRKIVRAALLGWADRLAGAALGLLAAAMTAALLVLPVVAYTSDGRTSLTRSTLAPYVVTVSDVFNRFVPDDLAERYKDGVRQLRSRWQSRDLV